MKTKTIRLSRIKITKEMQSTMPRAEKITQKYEYFRRRTRTNNKYGTNHNPLQSPIILDKHNVLIDGYTSYLIANMFGIKKVDVIIK
jgi:hypothetical protein